MNRKYRVWDLMNLEWRSNIVVAPSGVLYITYAGQILPAYNPERYVVEYSSGLPDKEGREIYAGDILGFYREPEGLSGSIWPCVVEFDGVLFAYREPKPWDKYTIILRKDEMPGVKIRGNIHENQELLKEKSITTSLLNEIEDMPYATEFAKQIDADFKADAKKGKF